MQKAKTNKVSNLISEAYEKLKKVRYQDSYHQALCYCLGISADTRKNVNRIYDFKSGCVKMECLHICSAVSMHHIFCRQYKDAYAFVLLDKYIIVLYTYCLSEEKRQLWKIERTGDMVFALDRK